MKGLLGDTIGVLEASGTRYGETWAWAKIDGGHAGYSPDVLSNFQSLGGSQTTEPERVLEEPAVEPETTAADDERRNATEPDVVLRVDVVGSQPKHLERGLTDVERNAELAGHLELFVHIELPHASQSRVHRETTQPEEVHAWDS